MTQRNEITRNQDRMIDMIPKDIRITNTITRGMIESKEVIEIETMTATNTECMMEEEIRTESKWCINKSHIVSISLAEMKRPKAILINDYVLISFALFKDKMFGWFSGKKK
jgi:predicted ATPase